MNATAAQTEQLAPVWPRLKPGKRPARKPPRVRVSASFARDEVTAFARVLSLLSQGKELEARTLARAPSMASVARKVKAMCAAAAKLESQRLAGTVQP